jgi:tetratricopeptide (TPR) repeat protein
MRLLRAKSDNDFELVTYTTDDLPPYAILSHTWTEGEEVTYDELLAGTGKAKAGYAKIRFCGQRAAQDDLEYFWVDTCCINKATNNELSTAINSMFRWYQRASKCYAYLSDVRVPDEVVDVQAFRITWEDAFRRSRWFTRGWTLQELLAPSTVEFFSQEGQQLGSKISLERDIHEITKIPTEAIRGQRRLSEFSVEQRMVWAEKRVTTVKEDKVYCLLGIFGVFMPLIYGEREEYAFLRLKEEIRRRQEGRGLESPRDLSASLLLPFPRNESFVGREDQLRCLEKLLLPPLTHRRMTIYGLGGCGKSALALQFAYRTIAKDARHRVFWVPAISRETFELAYREIGILLGVPGITDDNADVKQLVKKALNSGSSGDWLMIVDNADDSSVLLGGTDGDARLSLLSDCLPRSDRGTILFTTRSRRAAENMTQSNVIELNDMDVTEARQLLAQRLSEKALLEDEGAVDELLRLLAYLPLAIVQAAAFINSNGASISDYIALFRQPSTEIQLFSEQFEDPHRYREMESTIAKTWHISFDQILKQDQLAADYLSFMACIDRVNIPQSLLPLGNSPLQQVKAIGTLKGYAFITERQQVPKRQGEKVFDIHRLVHMASILWLEKHHKWTGWTSKAAERLKEVVPYGGHEKKEEWTTYLSHAIHVAGFDGIVDEARRASLLDRIGRCQASLGQYSAAEMTHRQCLSLREKRLGKEHYQTLTSSNGVGAALQTQGKYEEAELMHRQTLATREKVLSLEHPDTLTTINNLALVLDSQGKYEEAELMHRQTLATREKVLGLEHPNTLTTMNNLAGVLGRLGKYEEAESMHRQTLATREKVLGLEHPNTLTTMNNLAGVLGCQGKYEEAESMHRQTLATCEKVLSLEHPDTLTTMNNLALVLGRQGKYEEAESMHRQELAMCEKVLGLEHPDTLTSIYCLAHLLAKRNSYDEAVTLYQRACAGYTTSLGHNHPTTRACHRHYSKLLQAKEPRQSSILPKLL